MISSRRRAASVSSYSSSGVCCIEVPISTFDSLIPLMPPWFHPLGLPEVERDGASAIGSALSSLEWYIKTFRSALSLFDFSQRHVTLLVEKIKENRDDRTARDEHEMMREWPFVAARDGAMTIYHFGRARDGIHETLGSCPVLRGRVDIKKLREASKLFSENFPDYVDIRHAVAHREETKHTPKAIKRHALRGVNVPGLVETNNNLTMIFTGNLIGRNFTSAWEGKLLSYEVSGAVIIKMEAVRSAYYEAFQAAERATQTAAVAAQAPKPPSAQ